MFSIKKVLDINILKSKNMKKIFYLIAIAAIVSLASCVSGPTYPLGHENANPINMDSITVINDSTFLYEGDTITIVNHSYN